jgi:hypothetical protein
VGGDFIGAFLKMFAENPARTLRATPFLIQKPKPKQKQK